MLKLTLKAARVNKGLTQQEAAKRLKISNKTLLRWEKGETMPTANYILALCELYEIGYDNINFLP